MNADDQRIGFVGVGAMGAVMVGRLRGAGFAVTVFDSDAGRAHRVAEASGAELAATLGGLAEAEVVICMLPSSAVVDEVVGGAGGLITFLKPGSLIVDMGSSDPEHTVRLAKLAAERGIALIDAPVSGGVARARTGELTVMVAGDGEHLARVRPQLAALGTQIVPVGAVGAGHALKALNNLLSAIGLTAASEVLEVGRRFGLDPRLMMQVINTSTGRNHATETKIEQHVLSEKFESGFLMRLMVKDISTAIALARSQSVSTPLGDACLATWRRMEESAAPDADQTEIAKLPQRRPGQDR